MSVKRRGKVAALVAAAALAVSGLTACSSDADVASANLSKDAENFKVLRRTVFYNGITDTYILEVTGYCSVEPGSTLTITCKTEDGYKKHFLQNSDNVTWFAEQIDARDVSAKRYKVVFKPSTILPDIEAR